MAGTRESRPGTPIPDRPNTKLNTTSAASVQPDPDRLLAAALWYAATGWPVFPCRPDAKVPLTAHGCKDASTDPVRVRAWWSRWPLANIGVATGAPGPDVLDIDTKRGAPGFATLNRLVRAGLVAGAGAMVRTPSGGLHLYYLGSDQGNGTLPTFGIDYRGRGGYVLAAPSVVDGNPYVPTERREFTARCDWSAIKRYLQPPTPQRSVPRPGGRSDVGALVRWLAGQHEGNRNAALYWACCRALESGHDDLTDLESAGVTAGLDEAEIRRTVESARRKVSAR